MMADYGFAVRNSAGRLWMSPDVTPMNFIEKLTFTATGGIVNTMVTSVPRDVPITFFVKYSSKYSFDVEEVNGASTRTYLLRAFHSATVTVTMYVFATMVPRLSKYGLNIYNKMGALVYSAQMRPLEINQYTVTGNLHAYDIDMGEPIAVMPMYTSFFYTLNSPTYLLHMMWSGATGNRAYSDQARLANSGGPIVQFIQDGFFYIKTSKYD
ncbi:hypothetical protein [Yersinia intermedia]|uniref:hypothetical protein n=1 Tax=Yersinia intermedia TaxID=631 RepID=UPI001CFCC664|nr:hypothetical protein [Yersinia intermedia]MCB5312089.1 hypothetical protein [Yersinia intermedia]MCB5322059.1 hypothetical protein [Yersinia intermedia]MCB5325186.1 hypothetical protein [Yersinia intermedia]